MVSYLCFDSLVFFRIILVFDLFPFISFVCLINSLPSVGYKGIQPHLLGSLYPSIRKVFHFQEHLKKFYNPV